MAEFDIEYARKAATFTVLAYKEGEELVIPEGYTMVKELLDKKTDSRALAFKTEGLFVLSFRGTDSFKNVLTDLKIAREKYPTRRFWFRKYRTHKGFAEAYQNIRDQIKDVVEEHVDKKDKILVTGHSLGGALATITGQDLKRTMKFKNEVISYTFGSPMVGNKHFSRMYNKKVKHSFRVVNDGDIVPQAPPGSFKHVKDYVLIDEGKKIIVKPGFWERIEKNLEGWGEGILTGKALKAHSSDGYKAFMYDITDIQID
ncbi:MAG: lipase family protein [Candidatus Heimdallarchaeota archaeon]|nr:lipase family protein [Candidatus Heimdallarchaeota archaeon]